MANPTIPEMIERVARVLFDANAGKSLLDIENEPQWDLATPIERLYYILTASAAIKEMRDPTDAMKLTASDVSGEQILVGGDLQKITRPTLSEAECRNIWHAMIDAALGK